MAKLRLMTHNQWKCDKNQPAWEEQGYDCSAAVRAQGFVRVYRETTPPKSHRKKCKISEKIGETVDIPSSVRYNKHNLTKIRSNAMKSLSTRTISASGSTLWDYTGRS